MLCSQNVKMQLKVHRMRDFPLKSFLPIHIEDKSNLLAIISGGGSDEGRLLGCRLVPEVADVELRFVRSLEKE